MFSSPSSAAALPVDFSHSTPERGMDTPSTMAPPAAGDEFWNSAQLTDVLASLETSEVSYSSSDMSYTSSPFLSSATPEQSYALDLTSTQSDFDPSFQLQSAPLPMRCHSAGSTTYPSELDGSQQYHMYSTMSMS